MFKVIQWKNAGKSKTTVFTMLGNWYGISLS